MLKKDIVVGGHYTARISGNFVTVRVEDIRQRYGIKREQTVYDVLNLKTGRRTTFASAAKFRGPAKGPVPPSVRHKGGEEQDPLAPLAGQQEVDPVEDEQCSDPIAEVVAPAADILLTNQVGAGTAASAGGDVTCPRCGQTVAVTDGRYEYHRHPQKGITCGLSGERAVGAEGRCADPTLAPTVGPTPLEIASVSPPSSTSKSLSGTPNSMARSNRLIGASSATITTGTTTAAGATTAQPIGSTREGNTSVGGVLSRLKTPPPAQLSTGDGKVAGYTPTEEQAAIIAAARRLQHEGNDQQVVLIVQAGAGAGKTSTDLMLEEVLRGRGQYTCFSRSLTDQAKTKFKRAKVTSTYGLAFAQVGKLFAHRLNKGQRQRSSEVATFLGLSELQLDTGALDMEGKPVVKTLPASKLAWQCTEAVRKFCQSADSELGEEHFGYITGLDQLGEDGKRTYRLNNRVRKHLLPYAKKVWADLCNREGLLKFGHDAYFKQWQLGLYGPPIINADYILVDEFQDSDPVLVDVLRRQNALLILVGDDAQQIFEWRGAINALKSFPEAETLYLSQSFRFGQAIADVANSILATLDEPTDLVMRGCDIPSRVLMPVCEDYDDPVETPNTCRTILCRTNACAVGTVLVAFKSGKRPHLIGGGGDTVAFVRAALDLQRGRSTSHPELCLFKSWSEVQEYVKEDEGSDLKLMIKLIDEFKCQPILDALENMPSEEDADLVVSTAHKSKGREWTSVRLAPDFLPTNRMGDADRRLLYVAATRAQHVLDISVCPPFLPGKDRDTGKEVPPIRVQFTKPVPTGEELNDWLTTRSTQTEGKKANADPLQPVGLAKPTTTTKPAREDSAVSVTYSKLKNGDWGLRATSEIRTGQVVTVTTKAGERRTETVGKIVWSGSGVWLATKGSNGNSSSGKTSGQVCAECGKSGYLVADLEDGLMKHRKCCDIEP